jgi:hypothetical protein
LIAPGVVIEELRINRNFRALLWRLDSSERPLWVQEVETDVKATDLSSGIGQDNNPGARFRIVSDLGAETSGASVMSGNLPVVRRHDDPP